MRYLKYVFVAAIALFSFCGCDDKNEVAESPVVPEEPETPTPDVPTPEEPDYLFMFYGVGGVTLDGTILSNIFQALDAGNDDKVKMTFEYKMSFDMQGKYPDFDGTRRFTGEDNEHLKGQFKSISSSFPLVDETKYNSLFAGLKTEKVGGADYAMTSSDNLTDFIKWSKEKYSAAKRTVLVLAGHGRGWALSDDGALDMAETRSVLTDDNTNKFMSLNAVVNGVKNAGNVDLIYADACLMSMYEVLYGYAGCAKYFMASMETTPALGGDYINFISLLKQAGSTDEGLEEALRKHCDYCVSELWDKSEYSDLGFFDLTKLSKLTGALQEVTNTLVEKFTSEESIDPAQDGELPLGDRFGKYISNAFMKCEIVDSHINLKKGDLAKCLIPIVEKSDAEWWDKYALLSWLGTIYNERNKEEYADIKRDIMAQVEFLSFKSNNSFSLTDLLRVLDNSLVEVGARNNPFGSLRTELLSALKEMSYIRCTTPKKLEGIDEAYELCSPGILIAPLGSNTLYEDWAYARDYAGIDNAEDALKSYQSTAFDQQIGWSRMLGLLDVLPSFLYNPVRPCVK